MSCQYRNKDSFRSVESGLDIRGLYNTFYKKSNFINFIYK